MDCLNTFAREEQFYVQKSLNTQTSNDYAIKSIPQKLEFDINNQILESNSYKQKFNLYDQNGTRSLAAISGAIANRKIFENCSKINQIPEMIVWKNSLIRSMNNVKISDQIHRTFALKINELFDNDLLENPKWKDKLDSEIIKNISKRKEIFNSLLKGSLENDSIQREKFLKIEKETWDTFFATTYNVKRVSMKNIVGKNNPHLKNNLKEGDCLHYALHKLREGNLQNFNLVTLETSADYVLSLFMESEKYKAILKPEKGALILYFDEKQRWRHAGIFHDETVVESKWSNLPIFRHLPGEVPSQYGNSYIILKKVENCRKFAL